MLHRLGTLLLVATCFAASPASAASYLLTSNNSQLTVTDNNGATVWYVDAGASPRDNLFLPNFYFRVGATGNESNFLNALGAPTVQQNAANSLTLAFAGPTLSATINWTLVGGAAGSNTSVLAKSVSVTNLTADAIDLRLFDDSDYDINFDQFNQADQAALVAPGHIVTTSATSPIQISSIASVTPDHYQITDFITPYLQLFFDTDGPTTLSDQPGLGTAFPSVPGDNAFAFQWDRTLGAGQSFFVSQVSTYSPAAAAAAAAAVPEPASWAMLIGGFGLAGGALRRRTVVRSAGHA